MNILYKLVRYGIFFIDKGLKENVNVINAQVVAAGVKVAVGYGKHVNALKANSETAANNLTTVIKTCFQYLAQQQVYSPSLSKFVIFYNIDCEKSLVILIWRQEGFQFRKLFV